MMVRTCGQECPRIRAALWPCRKPIHVAVTALREKFAQMFAVFARQRCPRHRDSIEAERNRRLDEGRLDFFRSRQKSRSAYVRDGWIPGNDSVSSGRNEGRDFTLAYQFFAASSWFHGTSPR